MGCGSPVAAVDSVTQARCVRHGAQSGEESQAGGICDSAQLFGQVVTAYHVAVEDRRAAGLRGGPAYDVAGSGDGGRGA